MAGWRSTFRRNWIYMMAATMLSVLLWVAVSAETISERSLDTDLTILNLDRRYIMVAQSPPDIETVRVSFTGPEGAMLALQIARPRIVIELDSITESTMEIELDPSMVEGRGGLELGDVRATNVRPNRLRLEFEPRAQKVVPVVPDLIVSLEDGYTLSDSIRVQPGVIAIEGPESLVQPFDTIRTVSINQQRLSRSTEVEAQLDVPVTELLELSAEVVTVSIAVEPRAERAFPGIPVSIFGVDISDIRIEPSLIDVRLIGPKSIVDAIRPETLTPTVTIASEEELGRPLPVELIAPSPFVRVEVVPDSAIVNRVDRD